LSSKEDNEVWGKMILMVAIGLTVVITVALIYGSRRWESATKEMRAKLEAARRPIGRKTYSPDELIGLPALSAEDISVSTMRSKSISATRVGPVSKCSLLRQ
jgi:hypothetical protein